jgi:serine/threonine-protein kinase
MPDRSESIPRLNAALEGRYRIERQLGEGGMATVFLATDLRHNRQVAIKVLKPELAAVVGAERFLAEIETTANLQHPHILPLFDSGEADGFLFFVTPFVDWETLRHRLDREKQLPVDEALGIAASVCNALQVAHDAGIVHRDIKPANILLQSGEPLVADFGIALAVAHAGSGRLTETGLSVGTPFYMSPEQATGDRDPDARSDLYSLACVLYEMLVGDPPHTGSTAQAVVAKILTRDPDPVSESRRSVPDHVEAAVDRALERLPADRFSSAAEFAAALKEGRGLGSGAGGRRGGAEGAGDESPSRLTAWLWPVAAVLAGLMAVWGWSRSIPDPELNPPTRLAVPAPNLGGAATAQNVQLDLSPDGSTLLYTAIAPDGQNRTLVRRLYDTESEVVQGVVPFLSGYAISPDGREFVGYTPNGDVYRYTLDGRGERKLPEGLPMGWIAWDESGGIWLTNDVLDQGPVRVAPSGEATRPFGDRFGDRILQQILPGGTALAMIQSRGVSSGPVVAFDLETGNEQVLLETDVSGVQYTAGFLVYVLPDGFLEAVSFDPRALRVTGEPVRIAEGVAVEAGATQLATADNGTVAYIPEEPRSLVLVERDGSQRDLTSQSRNFHAPTFSPEGRRLAVDFTTPEGRNVWVLSLDEGVPTRATFDEGGHDARWTPDGRELTYLANPSGGAGVGIYRTRPGNLSSDSVYAAPEISYTGMWLNDQSALVTVAAGLAAGSGEDLAILRDGGRGTLEPLLATRFNESWPAVSPDDDWLAYVSDRSGSFEVYVRRLDGEGDEIQVSLSGGQEPLWSRDGRELFYRTGVGAGSQLVSARVSTDPQLEVLSRQALFSVADMATATPHVNYDVSPDGQSLVMVRFNPASRIMIIQNLPELVRKLSGGASAQ